MAPGATGVAVPRYRQEHASSWTCPTLPGTRFSVPPRPRTPEDYLPTIASHDEDYDAWKPGCGTTTRPARLAEMIEQTDMGKSLVAEVRAAAARHRTTWDALVPDQFTVDLAHELAEESAYAEMAAAKRRLRDHICETYGLSARELASLAS